MAASASEITLASLARELKRRDRRRRRADSLLPQFRCPKCGGTDTQSFREIIHASEETWTFFGSDGRKRIMSAVRSSRHKDAAGPEPRHRVEMLAVGIVALIAGLGVLALKSSMIEAGAFLCIGVASVISYAWNEATLFDRHKEWRGKKATEDKRWKCHQCSHVYDPADYKPPDDSVPPEPISGEIKIVDFNR